MSQDLPVHNKKFHNSDLMYSDQDPDLRKVTFHKAFKSPNIRFPCYAASRDLDRSSRKTMYGVFK